jgi:hypothetical protein
MLIALLALGASGVANGGDLPPSVAGGAPALAQWIKGKGLNVAAEIINRRPTSNNRELVLVGHNRSSGVSAVDIHIYVCSERVCSLLASRYHIPTDRPERKISGLVIFETGTMIEIRADDGSIQLSTPSPGP